MSTTFSLNEVRRRKIVENLSVLLNRWKDSCKGSPETVTISDILYLFGHGDVIFIRE